MSLTRNRRTFLKQVAAAASITVASPGLIRAAGPWANEKLRTAHIGVGGMGASDLGSIASHPSVEIAALCDVDRNNLSKAHAQHPDAKTWVDFRDMIAEMADTIDAVVVSTPDHTHAPAAMMAMNRGLHVYCQKPLTHEVFEARQLRRVAEQKGLVTQMGIQIHSARVYREAVQMIQDGVIGRVSKVHAWSNKNWGYDGGPFESTAQPPESLEWDLWLGTASERPYVPNVYHPANWRRLIDFGTGTLGDMGVHIFDTPYGSLQLTAPKWARTSCRPPTGIGHPTRNKVAYEFPGTRFTTDSLMWHWYDGADAPPKKEELGLPDELSLPDDYQLPGQGSLFVGENGVMVLPHIAPARLFPESRFADYQRPELEDQDHYHQWVDACMGQGKTSADFSFGGPLTEALLLGVVANRFPDQKLEWDATAMKVTNLDEANHLLRREYRQGFEVENL